MKILLDRIRQGDKAAERQLFDYLFDRFCRIAKLRVYAEDVQDIAQSACLTILEKLEIGLSERNFEAWAYSILRNIIGNYYRGEKLRQDKKISLSRCSDIFADQDDQRLRLDIVECMKLIMKSRKNFARVLNLIYQGYTTDEIAKRTKLKSNNVYVILNRGRKLLQFCIDNGKLK